MPGEGTAFTLRLHVSPVRARPAPDRADSAAALAPTALVVDDAPEVRQFLRARLGHEGVCTDEAGSCAEALAVVRAAGRFDLVLLDLQLPDGAGKECLWALRPLLPTAVFVAFTGETDPDVRALCLAQGFDDYLPKPFTDLQLASVLALLEKAQVRPAA